jgi:hypothetical protein
MAGALTISTLNNDTGVLATQNGMTGIAKAWVNFVGSNGSVNASFNVSSVTRNGTGDYTINFTTAMPNVNYGFAGSMAAGSASTIVSMAESSSTTRTTSLFRIYTGTQGAVLIDPVNAWVSIFSS